MSDNMNKVGLRKNKPDSDYGIVKGIPMPEDLLYWLDYDTERGFLLLNDFVIQRFHWEGNVDKIFTCLFKEQGDVKQITLEKGDANAIINNIKMPLSFRKAVFRTSDNGKKIQITTKITRARLKQFRVSQAKVDAYIHKKRDEFYKTEKD
jgi:hypothetical protein